MQITFLGTGTSQGIPVIACPCEVCASKNPHDQRLRSSVWLKTEELSIVIDTGPDFRAQMLRAGVHDLDAVLFTHEHKDHIAGLDDIRPYNYLLQKKIDVYATLRVQEALRREFHYIFSDNNYFGVPLINLHSIENGQPFFIRDTAIWPFEVLHYKLPVTGYRIGDFVYITDAKTVSAEVIEKLKGCKILVINALQTAPHISHFTLEEAIAFSQLVGAEQSYFTHISHNLGMAENVQQTLPPNIFLAYDGLQLNI